MGQNFVYIDAQNDFLNYKGSGTDKYFTGGITSGGLVNLKKDKTHFLTIALTQRTFTPSNIVLSPEEINPSDYPYAGLTYFSVGYLVFNETNTAYTKGTFLWGTTGPSSGAKMMQRELHKIIGDREPMGWSTQLQLGNFVQTQIEHTRSVINTAWFKVNMAAAMELGSIFNNTHIGTELKIDHDKEPFIGYFTKKFKTYTKPHVSVWALPKLEYVISNRLLQTNQNPSGYLPRIINRFSFHTSIGISLQIKKLSISLIQHNNTPEFKTASYHAFGEISFQLNI